MPTLRPPSHRSTFPASLLLLAWASGLSAQAAVDPNIASRAVALDRQGERQVATDMLGHYLATAPDDGRAWLQLGRFYLLDSRDWHARGHLGDPPGALYLDFAATALDQAVRLTLDSGLVFRAMVEMDRVLIFVEDSGWDVTRSRRPPLNWPELPPFLLELGTNLLTSCPLNGVLLTGNDLESLTAGYASFAMGYRSDVLQLRPDFYATDSAYRRSMAVALEADPAVSVRETLARTAARRPVCLSPLADSAAAPLGSWTPVRLVRVSGRPDPGAALPEPLTVTDLIAAERDGGTAWTREVRAVYQSAARYNRLLCAGILALVGDPPLGTCGR